MQAQNETPDPERKLLNQFVNNRVFKRLERLFRDSAVIITFFMRRKGIDYEVSEAEAPQFMFLFNIVKKKFEQDCRNTDDSSNLFFMQVRTKLYEQSFYSFFRDTFFIEAGLPEAQTSMLPKMFQGKSRRLYLLIYVLSRPDRRGLVMIIRSEYEKIDADSANKEMEGLRFFALKHNLLYPMRKCSGCATDVPAMQLCKVCSAPFCDRDCMTKHWTTHKLVCISRSDETRKLTDAMAKVSLTSEHVKENACPCGKPTTLRCNRCEKQWYCSRQCQKACWPWHQVHCNGSQSKAQDRREQHTGESAPPRFTCQQCGAAMDAQGAVGARCAACSQ